MIALLVASEIIMWRAAKGTEEIGRRDTAIILSAAPFGALYALLIFPWNPRGDEFPEFWDSIGIVVGSITILGISIRAAKKIRRDGELGYSAFSHVGQAMGTTTVFCVVVVIVYLIFNS